MPDLNELEAGNLEIAKSIEELARLLKRDAFGDDTRKAGDHVLLAINTGVDLLEKAVDEWLASVQKENGCANDR